MPVSIVESDVMVALPEGFLKALYKNPEMVKILPGSILTPKRRATHLVEALGMSDDLSQIPLRSLRHLPAAKINRQVRQAILVAHGAAWHAIAESEGICPLLHEAGVSVQVCNAGEVRNGRKEDRAIARRNATLPCPGCLAASLLADVAAGAVADAEYAFVGNVPREARGVDAGSGDTT